MLSFWDFSYAFYTLDQQGLALLTDDRIFRERILSDGIEHELYLDGVKVVLSSKDKKKLQIYITSDNEVSPLISYLSWKAYNK